LREISLLHRKTPWREFGWRIFTLRAILIPWLCDFNVDGLFSETAPELHYIRRPPTSRLLTLMAPYNWSRWKGQSGYAREHTAKQPYRQVALHRVHTRINVDDGDDPKIQKYDSNSKCGSKLPLDEWLPLSQT